MDCGKKWFVVFDTKETQLVSFDRSNNTGAINVKMDESVLFLFVCLFVFNDEKCFNFYFTAKILFVLKTFKFFS